MVRPACFAFNLATADSNPLQQRSPLAAEVIAARAQNEFDALHRALQSEGIEVCVAADTPQPPKPDAVFPNNWVSFHADGTVVLYPMQASNRRLERRHEVLDQVCTTLGFAIRQRLDLTHHESAGRFLEGTGSLVLDHAERVAYACRSPRTDAALVGEWARLMAYEPVVFDAADLQGRPYYHTNVLMWIGSRCALACIEAIAAGDRERVSARLRASGRELIEINRTAVAAFAGNMLELASWDEALGDCSVLAMSVTARAAVPPDSFHRLSGCVDTVLAVPVPTIEQVGGGSVRCMLAEVPETRR
jgi:hypothetical protein